MIYEVRKSPIHRNGLFALQNIPADTFIGEYQGQRSQWFLGMFMGNWTMRFGDETRNGYHRGNELRFINHSDDPNLRTEGFLFFALRDIEADDELTWDYGW